MPKLEWLKKEFSYGYKSGNILSVFPSKIRKLEESRVGGSYVSVFEKGILPNIHDASRVLEIGPGRGDWSRAIMEHVPEGELHVVDFQDVTDWIRPVYDSQKLFCHRVSDTSPYNFLQNDFFDFCWSFGVLCHNNIGSIKEILKNILPKMKPGAVAVHQYADWNKLEKFGWQRGAVPDSFKNRPDDEIWWPRNNQSTMVSAACEAGWDVITPDLNVVERDSIIMLRRPNALS